MTEIDNLIRWAERDIFLARHGIGDTDISKLERNLQVLYDERDRQRQQDLTAAALLAKMTAPRLREPSCLSGMSPDEWIGPRRTLRTQRMVEGHH